MKKEPLRTIILKRFYRNYKNGKQGFIHSQVIQDVLHASTGKMHATISRELRRLAEEGWLERNEMKIPPYKVSSVYYRYTPKVINS